MHAGEQSGEDGYDPISEEAAANKEHKEPTMADHPPNESTPLINSGVL